MGTFVQTPHGPPYPPPIGNKILSAITLPCDPDSPEVIAATTLLSFVIFMSLCGLLYWFDLLALGEARSFTRLASMVEVVGSFLLSLSIGIGWVKLHDFT